MKLNKWLVNDATAQAYKDGRKDAEIEHDKMCQNCIHKVSAEDIKAIEDKAIEEFAHALKETFNNEFPMNYHCTQPYFTLDNVRVLIDLVAKERKKDVF